MRCLFTMFAEDVDLIPKDCFTELLGSLHGDTNSAKSLRCRALFFEDAWAIVAVSD